MLFYLFNEIYNGFLALEAVVKFYISLAVALFFFIYKTFLSMYTEDEKLRQNNDLKSKEMVSKLAAAMAVYKHSSKDTAAQDKVVISMGDAFPYLDFNIRAKIQKYYVNRTPSSLDTLQKIIMMEAEKFASQNEKQTRIEKIMYFASRVIRPLFAIVIVLVILSVVAIGEESFLTSKSKEELSLFFVNFVSWLFSGMMLTLSLDFIFSGLHDLRGDRFVFWTGISIMVLVPLLFFILPTSIYLLVPLVQAGTMVFLIIRKKRL